MVASASAPYGTAIVPASCFPETPLPRVSLFAFPSRRIPPSPFYPHQHPSLRLHSFQKSSLSSRSLSADLHQKVTPDFSFCLSSSALSPFSFSEAIPEIRPREALSELTTLLPLCKRILLCLFISIPLSFICGSSFAAADDSIRASGFGLKVATALRKSGWGDEATVFLLATLPVIELRGAIPVGYWMRLDPLKLTILSVLGNMVPVPIIVLYLKKFAGFLSKKSDSATKFLEILFEKAREKAGPVEEFQWLGLMLFVAVPFPGTGAWTGAIIATILDMPFCSAMSANFFGVVLAGLLVNLLVNLGLKYAIGMGIVLFFASTFMWSILRSFKNTMNTK